MKQFFKKNSIIRLFLTLKGVELASTRTSVGTYHMMNKNAIYSIDKIYFYTNISQIDVKIYFCQKMVLSGYFRQIIV